MDFPSQNELIFQVDLQSQIELNFQVDFPSENELIFRGDFPPLFLPLGLGAPSSFFQPLIYLQTDVLNVSGRKSPHNIRRAAP